MLDDSVAHLVSLLKQTELRTRTGIVELPTRRMAGQADIAVLFGVGFCDMCAWKCARIPSARTHLGIRREDITDDLHAVLADLSIPGYCVWVSGLDVFLARIPYSEREHFWQFMRSTFRPPRGLIISLPVSATNILPDEERLLWRRFGRLSELGSIPVSRMINE
jgi:hypothetical protein